MYSQVTIIVIKEKKKIILLLINSSYISTCLPAAHCNHLSSLTAYRIHIRQGTVIQAGDLNETSGSGEWMSPIIGYNTL